MIATMNAEGVITLKAETSAEAFALRQWIVMAEETTYVDVPGMPTRKPVLSWALSCLMVQTDIGT